MKKTKFFKTFVLLILSAALLFGTLPGRTYAATTISGTMGRHETNYGYFTKKITVYNAYYNKELCNYPSSIKGDNIPLFYIEYNGEIHAAYCIEPGARTHGDWDYSGASGDTTTDPYWNYLRNEHKEVTEAISLAIGYTEQYNGKTGWYAARAACQIIIWELMCGYRDPVTMKVTDTEFFDATAGDTYIKYYNLISEQMINHKVYPVYVATTAAGALTYNLSYDAKTCLWSAELPTVKGTVDMIDYSTLEAAGITVTEVSDTKVRFETSKPLSGKTTFRTPKSLPESLYSDDLYVWTTYSGGERGQCLVTGTDNDPIPLYMNLKTQEVGNLEVVKTAEDGIIDGVSFKVSDGTNSYTITTDSTGKANITLVPGTYTVTEVNTPSRYEIPKSATVTVKANTTVTVDVNNVLRKGTLKIIKNSTDNLVEGVSFTVSNNDGFEKTVTTDANGEVVLSGLVPGNYTIEETTDCDIYYVPENQTVTVEADKTATVNFDNINKRKLTVRYFDKYTNEVIHEEYTYTDKHNAVYDVTEQTEVMIDGYDFIDRIEGDPITGTLDTDKVVDVYYGYNHKITVNYYDKYTNEVINSQYVSEPIEHNSEYDAAEQILKEIEYIAESLRDTNTEINTDNMSDISSGEDENAAFDEEQTSEIINYYLFPELNAGDDISGILDCDKVVNLYYGYDHNVTVNYYDKYTNEVIYTQYASVPAEHLSEYDATDHKLEKIDFNDINYTLQDSLTTGDSISGTLDADKVINLYYGYSHNVTIEYRDEDTGEEIYPEVQYTPENEHLSEYDKTSDTTREIDGYTISKVTGDGVFGTLDEDKLIVVWYKKQPAPETGDDSMISICEILLAISCAATTLVKRRRFGKY
ncbi:MAG: hypothetical protein IJZ94_06045 [Clostridia bacterium]|nr:hypothetical protein [Clostridia bacterium]